MSIRRMAALGSSYAAGPGIPPVADAAAMRSERNYPHLVAAALGAALADATVSGATTDTILRSPQRVGRRRFVPQIESVAGPDLDLVTITAGGNDVGYLSSVMRTAIANRLDRRAVTAPLAHRMRGPAVPVSVEQVRAVADGLAQIVEAVAARAPRARILLVDYLTIVGPETRPSDAVPFTDAELDRIRDTAAKLGAAFQQAEQRSTAELVRVSELSAAHALDAAEPWVNGLRMRFPFRELPSSFHPNAAGMAAVAEAVLDAVQHG